MIQRLSHATVYVLDQDEALAFYRDKLGFEVRTDSTMDNGFRWLTVGPKSQPYMEIVLMKVCVSHLWDAEAVEAFKTLLRKGAFGIGVFDTDDCRATYAELKAKGVEFKSEPQDQFYGVATVGRDNSGNWFSLTEHKKPS
jgi:catechol 2,3-dioxygenase-like lactoylglutathione lyase family enzyme